MKFSPLVEEIVLVTCLLGLGLGLRLFTLPDLMPFTYDQGRDMLVLESMAHGDLRLVGPTTGIAGFFLGPFFYYALLPGFLLSNGSPAGVAIWQATVVSVSLVFFYLLLRHLTSVRWALVGLLLAAISPGAIDEARVIWNPSWALPLLSFSWLCLFYSLKKPWLLILAIVAYGLALQTEFAYVIFFAPLYGLWLGRFWLGLWFRSTWNQVYSSQIVGMALVAAATTLAPQLLFELRNDFIMTKSIQAELADTSKRVSLAQIWSERPSQMANTLEQRLFAEMPGSSVLFVILIMLALSLPFRLKTPAEWFIYGAFSLPLFGLLFFTGNHGFFFPYYLNPHYAVGIIVIIIVLDKMPRLMGVVSLVLVLSVGLAAFIRHASIIYNHALLNYTLEKQIAALRYTRDNHTTPSYAAEVFVPNLKPVQYEYLDAWLEKSGQLSPADFWIHTHEEFYLLYEPATSDGSKVALAEWYERHTTNAVCSYETKIGIVSIEHCYKLNR